MSSQNYPSDSFRFKRAAFLQSLESKVGLAASKAAALRINLNIEGCGIPSARSFSRSPSPSSFFHTIYQYPSPPRSLVRDGQTSPLRPRLVVSRSIRPPLSPFPHAYSFVIGTAVIKAYKHTHIVRGPAHWHARSLRIVPRGASGLLRAAASALKPRQA